MNDCFSDACDVIKDICDASDALEKAEHAYRNRQISYVEILAARAAFKDADEAFNAVFSPKATPA